MSQWLARHLVEVSGVPAEKVHVVQPGMAIEPGPEAVLPRDRDRTALLLVGRDFHVKSGDLVVRALGIIRRDRPDVTLTVVGPRRWPMSGDPPVGVRFLGAMPAPAVAELYERHDLL